MISDIETDAYDVKKCELCGSEMQFVYEPVTRDFTGYVCQKYGCDNHYLNLVLDQ